MSYASYQRFNNPTAAWEAYEARRLSNCVHRLPYVPSLIPDSTMKPPPAPCLPQPNLANRRHRVTEIWVECDQSRQPTIPLATQSYHSNSPATRSRQQPTNPLGTQSRSSHVANTELDMWEGTWPSCPAVTFATNPVTAPAAQHAEAR